MCKCILWCVVVAVSVVVSRCHYRDTDCSNHSLVVVVCWCVRVSGETWCLVAITGSVRRDGRRKERSVSTILWVHYCKYELFHHWFWYHLSVLSVYSHRIYSLFLFYIPILLSCQSIPFPCCSTDVAVDAKSAIISKTQKISTTPAPIKHIAASTVDPTREPRQSGLCSL